MWMCRVCGALLTLVGLMGALIIGSALYGSDGGHDSVVQMGIPGTMILTLAATSAIFAGVALARRRR